MTCPRCRQDVEPIQLKFTWWGGALGPRLLSHVECPQCRARFNGKTGADNTGAIAIYSVVVGALAFVLAFYLFRSM